MNKCASMIIRLKKKRKLAQDLEDYTWLNNMLQVYPPTSFKITDFASPSDPKPTGDRKQKNKITAKNSRIRKKRRNQELTRRITHLKKEADLDYMLNAPNLEVAAIISHDMFIKKIEEIPNLPSSELELPIDLSGWDI